MPHPKSRQVFSIGSSIRFLSRNAKTSLTSPTPIRKKVCSSQPPSRSTSERTAHFASNRAFVSHSVWYFENSFHSLSEPMLAHPALCFKLSIFVIRRCCRNLYDRPLPTMHPTWRAAKILPHAPPI